jgi:hypothetical protein
VRQHRTCTYWLHYLLGVAIPCGCAILIAILIAVRQSQPTQAWQGQQQDQNAQAGPRGGGAGGQPMNQVLGPGGELWGFSDLAEIPGTPWRIHDANRPQPRVVIPGDRAGAPPSDASVLFDGKDLSKWVQRSRNGVVSKAQWAVHDGIFESGPGGDISTQDSFADIQLHLEFATPIKVIGTSQRRGNSGVIFMNRYEIQILDSYNNRTYADGMAASIYGEWPPLVNATRMPGEWQTYDIVFEAPKFEGAKLVSPAYFTVFWNGVLVHNRKQVNGTTSMLTLHQYTPHEAELPLTLQNHGNPVLFRNIWIRRLTGYDQQ